MIVGRAELEASLARLEAEVTDPRAGIHGPATMAWRLERDALIFLGGGRAVLLQLAHPFVACGIRDHSRTRGDVVGRFQRTFRAVFAMSFGDLEHARRAARAVHGGHARVVGTIDEDAGAWVAGSAYAGNDADALRWVHATLVDTVVTVHEAVHGALAVADKDAYCHDARRFGRLFAIPEPLLPTTWSAHRAYVEAMLAGRQLAITAAARSMADYLFGGRLGPLARAVTAGLSPERLRDGFGLSFGTGERRAFAATLAAARALARLPAPVRDLPAYRDAIRRLRGLPPAPWSRWLERRLYALAGATASAAPAAA
jgi:uncharacterized protein (DUF2236 family)